MSTRTVTILSDFPKDNLPSSNTGGYTLVLGHDYDADATPERGGAKPEPVPTMLYGGNRPSIKLTEEDEHAFRRVHEVLDAIADGTYEGVGINWR